jgi:hypothetical protein
MSPSPTIGTHGFGGVHGAPFVHGGVVHGGNFVQHGAFVHGHGFVGPVHFFHPYYAFHPNVSIGFGLWAGYPFAYPYPFYNPYYYPYYPYYYYNLYPPYGSVSSGADASSSSAVLDQTNMGGLSFEITPAMPSCSSTMSVSVPSASSGRRRNRSVCQRDTTMSRFALPGTGQSVSMWISSPAK